MTVFAVVSLDQAASAPLAASIESTFQGKYFQVAPGHYLINAIGTSQEIATQLHITGGQLGRAMVYNISGYFGYGPNQAWEWLKANMSPGSSG